MAGPFVAVWRRCDRLRIPRKRHAAARAGSRRGRIAQGFWQRQSSLGRPQRRLRRAAPTCLRAPWAPTSAHTSPTLTLATLATRLATAPLPCVGHTSPRFDVCVCMTGRADLRTRRTRSRPARACLASPRLTYETKRSPEIAPAGCLNQARTSAPRDGNATSYVARSRETRRREVAVAETTSSLPTAWACQPRSAAI